MDPRFEFLQYAFLIVLMNKNLYESLQETLLDEINECPKWDDGEMILETIRKSVNWESLIGPEDVDQQILDDLRSSLYNKLVSYRRHGNLNS